MALRSDSALVSRIVCSFVRFLDSVEVVDGVDRESLEVASQCLTDAFRLDSRQPDEQIHANLLPELFKQAGLDPTLSDSAGISTKVNTASASGLSSNSSVERSTSEAVDDKSNGETSITGSFENLFEQFKDGLESVGHFQGVEKGTPAYELLINKATQTFTETVEKLRSTSSPETHILAEAFKAQGNMAMEAQRYIEAIDLYTMAISLCGDNAVYYSNRAAAHTQIGKYEEAIGGCQKAISLDPNYSKAYSRLGLVYYAQGKYKDAIEKGFKKAAALDPNNRSIQENLQATQRKLDQVLHGTQQRQEQSQQQSQQHDRSETHQGQGPSQGFNGQFPFQFPPEVANLFPGIVNLASQFNSRDENVEGQSGDASQQPEIRLDGNISMSIDGEQIPANINLAFQGDEFPTQVAGMMQSMLQMFAGGAPPAGPNDNHPAGNPNQGS